MCTSVISLIHDRYHLPKSITYTMYAVKEDGMVQWIALRTVVIFVVQ